MSMDALQPVAEQATAFLETYNALSPVTGYSVVFTQRYAGDGSKIGAPVQISSDQFTSTRVSTLLLSNGGFVVTYNTGDPNGELDEFGLPVDFLSTQEVAPDNSLIGSGITVPNDQYTFPGSFANTQSVALSGGAYAYLLQAVSFEEDVATTVETFGYVDAKGVMTTKELYENETEFGPYPNPVGTNAAVQHGSNGTFEVSYDIFYNHGSDYPAPPGRHFEQIYSDDDVLLRTVVTTDGGPEVFTSYNPAGQVTSTLTQTADGTSDFESFDPATSRELSETIRYADGSRTITDLAISGESYTRQTASYDAGGKLMSLERDYADGKLQLTQVVDADGSGMVRDYDTQGRETTEIATASDGSRTVTLDTYVGTATAPSTTQVFHYDNGNQLLSTDLAKTDGTHQQTAFTAGVTLTSTTGVADTFASARTGGDTFVFQPAFGQDLITGFHAGNAPNHDVIQFDTAVVPDYLHLQSMISSSGADTLIKVAAADTILLKGVAASALTSNDFAFKPHPGA